MEKWKPGIEKTWKKGQWYETRMPDGSVLVGNYSPLSENFVAAGEKPKQKEQITPAKAEVRPAAKSHL